MAAKAPKVSYPWDQIEFTNTETASIRAVRDGNATADQQRVAWDVILHKVCRVEALSFTAGPDGGRIGDFAEGKRWVARTLQLIAQVKSVVSSRGREPPMPAKDPAQVAEDNRVAAASAAEPET